MQEIIEAGKQARDKLVNDEFEICVRRLEHGEPRVGATWDGVAFQFKALGFKVARITYPPNMVDGTEIRWWIYAQPAEEGAQQP
jgi:hypothetical protein